MNIEKMKRERKEVIERAKAMIETAEAREDAKFTDVEQSDYDALEAEIRSYDERIARAERMAELDAATAVVVTKDEADKAPEFRNIGEAVIELVKDPRSPRLQKRTTSLSTGTQAGYVVAPEFDTTIRAIDPETVIVRPRATVIPASPTAPDAPLNLVAFDQGGTNGINGGMTGAWVAENAARPNTGDVKVQQITFTPQTYAGYLDVSNVLLDNSAALSAFVERKFRDIVTDAEETAFLSGTGTGQPTGLINHPCSVGVNRAAAGDVSYNDIVNMVSRTVSTGGVYTWIVSRAAMPKIMSLKDQAGNLVWHPTTSEGAPGTLMGYPVIFTERAPALGSIGDVTLADLSMYYIKDGSPLTILVDNYSQSLNDVTRLVLKWRVDGKPLLYAPIQGKDSVTRSPFVSLIGVVTP